jgi:hypothetical protein
LVKAAEAPEVDEFLLFALKLVWLGLADMPLVAEATMQEKKRSLNTT